MDRLTPGSTRNGISEEATAKQISQQAEEFVDDYHQLPSSIVGGAINSTFESQASQGEWVTLGSRKSAKSKRANNSTVRDGSSKRSIPKSSSEQKVISSLEALQIRNREKNRRKNEKRRVKKQMERDAAAEMPQILTPLQTLQKLIDNMEEYIPPRPSDKATLDQYIPWDELE
ncbi:hypothetical protein Taro_028582 [Colocasia esculenta]|uniref:Uncharacterized protein n=1 Tax=Colocasia esculenta TaxID=4460 RepID=A0A843VNJ2_COLES|nr:hypothetical protein [Colocasia esculenta]